MTMMEDNVEVSPKFLVVVQKKKCFIAFFLSLPKDVFAHVFLCSPLSEEVCAGRPPTECSVRFREIQHAMPVAQLLADAPGGAGFGSASTGTASWLAVPLLAMRLSPGRIARTTSLMPVVVNTAPSDLDLAGLPSGDAGGRVVTGCHPSRQAGSQRGTSSSAPPESGGVESPKGF